MQNEATRRLPWPRTVQRRRVSDPCSTVARMKRSTRRSRLAGGIVVADLLARPQPVGEVGGGEGLAGLLFFRADDHRASDAGEELDLEQLLHAGGELEQAGGLAGAEVDDGD